MPPLAHPSSKAYLAPSGAATLRLPPRRRSLSAGGTSTPSTTSSMWGGGGGGHTGSWAKLHLGFLGAQAPFVEGGRNVRLCSPVHRRLSCQARGGHRRLLCNCSLPAPTAVCLHSTPTSLAAATTPRCVLAASMLRCWLQGCSVAAGMHLQDWRARDQAELLTAGGRCAKPEANNASVWRKQGHVYCGRRVRSCLALCSYPPRPRASCSG
jgi:hypothetical protein